MRFILWGSVRAMLIRPQLKGRWHPGSIAIISTCPIPHLIMHDRISLWRTPPQPPAPPAPLLPPPRPSQLPGFSQRLTRGRKNFLHWLPGSMGSLSGGREQHCLPIRPSSDSLLSAAYVSAKLSPCPAGWDKQIWALLSVSDQ